LIVEQAGESVPIAVAAPYLPKTRFKYRPRAAGTAKIQVAELLNDMEIVGCH